MERDLIKHWPWLPLQFSDSSSSNRMLFLLPASTWHTDLTANNSEGSDVCCRAEWGLWNKNPTLAPRYKKGFTYVVPMLQDVRKSVVGSLSTGGGRRGRTGWRRVFSGPLSFFTNKSIGWSLRERSCRREADSGIQSYSHHVGHKAFNRGNCAHCFQCLVHYKQWKHKENTQ